MSDDGFSEIQLSGKQLVFLFMATTVIAVVIFLCGVLVGRGVPQVAALSEFPGGATEAAAIALDEHASTANRPRPPLDRVVPGEDVNAIREIDSVAPNLPELAPKATSLHRPLEALPTAVAPAEGFTVQVAALRDRAAAEVIRDQLSNKGYPAYVVDPAPDVPAAVYRVRVGRYQKRAEAEVARRRLEQEEQFKPWITR